MKKLVVLSGAGISQESGIKTFRDEGGLWENFRIEEVASIEGYRNNPKKVLDFYNTRRAQLLQVSPNQAHRDLALLQEEWDVQIITQNIDDLHERAGSKKVLHLHGELFKVRPQNQLGGEREWKTDLHLGDLDSNGVQLRPHIVWFGEQVPEMDRAESMVREADVFLVIGTSLQVYPAANLAFELSYDIPFFLIDPQSPLTTPRPMVHIEEKSVKGMERFKKELEALKK